MNNSLRKQKQLSFFKPPPIDFGGSLLVGKRKAKRSLTTKQPIYMILKGDIFLSGSLLKQERWIDKEIKRLAEKFTIKLYDYGICSNHIHFGLRISSAENYKKFIRALTGRLAQVLKIKFFLRPFTKILSWGRQFQRVLSYIVQNKEEALGIRPYRPRVKVNSYRGFRAKVKLE